MQLPEFKSTKEFFQTIQGLLEVGQFPGTLAVDVVVAKAHTEHTLLVIEEQEKNEQAKQAAAAEENQGVSSDRSKKKPRGVGSSKASRGRRKNSKN